MKKLTLIAAGLMALGVLAGCGDDKKDTMAAPTSTAAAQKPTATSAANTAGATTAAVAANDDVPSEADFEEQTEKDITADNLESELDKLDKEIGQ